MHTTMKWFSRAENVYDIELMNQTTN